jgi:hypothetical protein
MKTDLPVEMFKIWSIARGLTGPWSGDKPDARLDKYKLETAIEALVEIGDLVEEFTKSRFGTDDLAKVPGGEEYHLLPDLNRRFAPYPE